MSASKNRIYFLLQRAAHRLKTEADAALTEAGGLTTAQGAVMLIIARDGPVTQRHIAKTLAQRESAITEMATRLTKAGHITRVRSASDARAWELETTEQGRQALANMQSAFAGINAKLDAAIDSAELDQLAETLVRLLKTLDA